MQSFRKRFEGRELEILNYINDNGGWSLACDVMEHFGANCVIAWGRYIDEITQELDFKFAPKDRQSHHLPRPLDLQYLDECASLVDRIKARVRLDAEIIKKKQRLAELERMLFEVQELPDEDFEPCELRIQI
jgi:hypothetical protein